ncbi:hypothetical protein GcC1_211035 [Golovinomyces cichoracearum]|uniref:Uncharacterized protein n=1 Tax=Golovinomyces cichoracearum TaxID=62708 RepID=A0A420HAR5_9PEZI|nr:hypothetical protein GcC1_211035 [Golovinomyces cichoracearum]
MYPVFESEGMAFAMSSSVNTGLVFVTVCVASLKRQANLKKVERVIRIIFSRDFMRAYNREMVATTKLNMVAIGRDVRCVM